MVATASEASLTTNVLSWVRGRLEAPDLDESIRGALEVVAMRIESSMGAERDVFLSVVIRTQLRRWEQLRDGLLSLAAQTDRDFEVLVMLHQVSNAAEARLRGILEQYPREFADKVRLVHVQGGGRTRPLSVSLDHIRGRYVSFFDDDDLLMAHWIESFRRGAEAAPGRVIRSNVAIQRNSAEIWGERSGQRTTSVISNEYAPQFNFLDNVERNHTPFMGIAFPREVFTLWGERFDESLPVCEDWDMILRAVTIAGVHSVDDMTAIYRQWEGVDTSYTAHDREEWLTAERQVREKLEKYAFLMQENSVDSIVEVLNRERKVRNDLERQLNDVLGSTTWRVFEPLRTIVRSLRARGISTRRRFEPAPPTQKVK